MQPSDAGTEQGSLDEVDPENGSLVEVDPEKGSLDEVDQLLNELDDKVEPAAHQPFPDVSSLMHDVSEVKSVEGNTPSIDLSSWGSSGV